LTIALAADISVLHIGAGQYDSEDRSHSTFAIWRELAKGFQRYTVVGRSTSAPATMVEGNLTVHLLSSRMEREAEFLWTQRHALHIARRVEPDAVVVQSPVLGGLAAAMIKRRRRAGVLAELHGREFLAPAATGSEAWLLQKLSSRVFAHCDRIRVLSSGMKQEFLTRYGGGFTNRLRVLPPRVDLARFEPTHYTMRADRLRLVMAGAINSNKGQRRVLDVLLKTNLPLEIDIAGDGPEREDCQRLIETHNAGAQARMHGRISHEKLADLLRAADVFVMYSKSEGTPRAIMEAMAVGLPIVTTDAGYCADIVAHGVEGYVLGADPDAEIVPVLRQLHENPDLRCRLGQAARARAVREFDANVLYAQYRALIVETANACR
jgi:glycosyltransferase involved in cell wall biosynthesis